MPGLSPRPASREDVLATAAIVSAVVIAAIVGPMVLRRLADHPSPEQCAELLDRYVDHVAHAVDPQAAASAIAARRSLVRDSAHAGQVQRKDGRSAFTECVSDLTMDEVSCAMKAESADAFERCLPVR